jgi:hypothetical protein
MTLEETVLEKLAEWHPPPEGRQTLIVPHESCGWTASVTAERHDNLGCALWELSLLRTKPLAEGNQQAMSSWAERIAGQVTGLLEPLRVVEIDVQRAEAQLRSNEPTRRKDDLYYYEVVLKGTQQATMRRFHASEKLSRREQVPFTLTHESVAKLTADLVFE